MSFTNKYPYTDFHELNLDWILDKISGIDSRFKSIEDAIEFIKNDLDENVHPAIDNLENDLAAFKSLVNAFLNYDGLEYNENLTYNVDDFCFYEGNLYRCTEETSGSFEPIHWQHIFLSSVVEENMKSIKKLFDNLGEEFTSDNAYNIGDLVLYDGDLYKVIAYIPVDDIDFLDKMQRVHLASEVATDVNTINSNISDLRQRVGDDEQSIAQLYDNTADIFDENTSYAIGDYVLYNSYLYRCGIPHPAGPFNPGRFTLVKVCNEIQDRIANLFRETQSTLLAGNTDLYVYFDGIPANAAIDVYTSEFGIAPTNIVVNTGVSVHLTFEALDHNIQVLTRAWF